MFLTFFLFLQVHLQETGGRGVLSVAASGFQLASRGGGGVIGPRKCKRALLQTGKSKAS